MPKENAAMRSRVSCHIFILNNIYQWWNVVSVYYGSYI